MKAEMSTKGRPTGHATLSAMTPTTTHSQCQYMRIPDIADHLGVSVSTVRRLTRTGAIVPVRIGSCVRVERRELDRYQANISRQACGLPPIEYGAAVTAP